MRYSRGIQASILIGLLLAIPKADADDEATIQLERFSEKVLIVRTGFNYFDQVAAIASTRGLVIIDTGISPSITAEYRKVIERELGRDDVLYVVNTHHHSDHTSGNQVFADAVIIGHERAVIGFDDETKAIADKIASRRARVAELEGELAELDADSDEAKQLRGIIYFLSRARDDLENRFVPTPPSLTFSDRMTLDLGDLTLRLIYFGKGRHTDSDIVVHLPEEGLLFTGDLVFPFELELSDTAEADVDRWIQVLSEVLEDENKVEHVVTGHFGILPRQRLATSLDEIRKLK